MFAIQVKNLRKSFGKVKAVDNVSFSIRPREIFGLLGVNGAGKSTIINILSGLTLPEGGKVQMLGKNFFTHEEELKKQFNVATAYYSLNEVLTVKQNLIVYAHLYEVENAEQRILELAEQFMIVPHLNTRVISLSSGERTRLVLVKALLNSPKLLFLDECTVGLDPDIAEITRDYLKIYTRKTGCTILFTSHYMQEVERLCDRVAFMDKGRIVKTGKPAELLRELKVQQVQLHFSKNIDQAKRFLVQQKINFQEKERVLSFKIKNQTKILYPLLEKLVRAGLAFDDIHLDKPTLEEYFIARSRGKQ